MKEAFKRATLPLRHKISKTLSPKLCNNPHLERPFILYLQALNRPNVIGAEIGVSNGDNALSILHKLKMRKLYLIDSYIQATSVYGENYAENKRLALERLGSEKNVQFIFKDSVKASYQIKEKLDFAYIDGDHSLKGVTRDIRAYYPLIKKGGYLGGHDFYGTFQGVVRGVLAWTKFNNLGLTTENFDWWVKKE